MNIICTVEIDAPIKEVTNIFANPELAKNWHTDLISITPVDGPPGEPGSTAILKFPKFDLLETVITNNLPDEFTGEYLASGICWNTMKNCFTDIGQGKTRYDVEVNYRAEGFMFKMIMKLMPGMLRKQILKSMQRLKSFAENQFLTSSKSH